MEKEKLFSLLKKAIEVNASDIHISADDVPAFRIDGKIHKTNFEAMNEDSIWEIIDITAPKMFEEKIIKSTDFDYPFEIPDVARFRINVAKSFGKHCLTIRIIPLEIPTIEELNLPESIRKFTKADNGIVIVTGVAGSGKSTTLASMLEHINLTRRKHIITIEDPVEYVYKSKKSIFTQRQIGRDTDNYNSGIKYALRQDPDVILIGEIRDAETVKSALYAAETGHLVFATLHTFNAIQTINRVLSFFSPSDRESVRSWFAEVYRGSISQRLLPLATGKGRIPATEILFSTPTIKDFILKNELEEIYKLVKKGSYNDMITFNSSLYNLYKNDLVTQEVALAFSDEQDELRRMIRGVYT